MRITIPGYINNTCRAACRIKACGSVRGCDDGRDSYVGVLVFVSSCGTGCVLVLVHVINRAIGLELYSDFVHVFQLCILAFVFPERQVRMLTVFKQVH